VLFIFTTKNSARQRNRGQGQGRAVHGDTAPTSETMGPRVTLIWHLVIIWLNVSQTHHSEWVGFNFAESSLRCLRGPHRWSSSCMWLCVCLYWPQKPMQSATNSALLPWLVFEWVKKLWSLAFYTGLSKPCVWTKRFAGQDMSRHPWWLRIMFCVCQRRQSDPKGSPQKRLDLTAAFSACFELLVNLPQSLSLPSKQNQYAKRHCSTCTKQWDLWSCWAVSESGEFEKCVY